MNIWKYPLAVADQQIIKMPRGAQILTVQMQAELACLWALVNPTAELEPRGIRIVGTGHELGGESPGTYVGTVQVLAGSLVFHVFEAKRP